MRAGQVGVGNCLSLDMFYSGQPYAINLQMKRIEVTEGGRGRTVLRVRVDGVARTVVDLMTNAQSKQMTR